MVRYTLDGYDIVLELLREGLEAGITVMSRIPDQLPLFVPLVVVRRTGGATRQPKFHTEFHITAQCWVAPTVAGDTSRVVDDLGDQVTKVLHQAWKNQTVTPAGHIAHWREASGWQEISDPDLPNYGRSIATYDLLLRKPRT